METFFFFYQELESYSDKVSYLYDVLLFAVDS
jgi:hypothetical protein